MGLTKTEIFTEEQNDIAVMIKALGHPARIAIIQHLIEIKSCVCGDLVEELGLAQATISQHLKELKKVGLIQGTIEGTSTCYCINFDNWRLLQQNLNDLFDSYSIEADCSLDKDDCGC